MESTLQKYQLELYCEYHFMYRIEIMDIREVSYEVTNDMISECIQKGKVADEFIKKFATLTYEQLNELLITCNPHNGDETATVKALTEYINNL